jgi:dihydropteroate synthase
MSRFGARVAIDDRRDAFLRLIGAKPVIMGILNVTPDSFSEAGAFNRWNPLSRRPASLSPTAPTSST